MEQTFVRRKYDPSTREFLESLCRQPHKNLPMIVEVEDDFYVMEYVQGRTLTEILAEQTHLSAQEAKRLILQLLDAAEVLHGFHIVHRDIKPDNIVIMDDGTLKLIDFDIARKIVTGKNRDTQYLGTAEFAAPEQYGFTQTDQRTDIYAIGVVYNVMLTGKHPNQAAVGGEVGKIIRKCTELDGKRRYREIRFLRKDIIGGRFSAYRIFDVIPGFRSRNLALMIFATVFYFTMFIGVADLLFTVGEPPDFFSVVVIIFAAVYVIIFYAIVLGKSIVLATPFPIRRFWLKKIVLAAIWYLFGSAALLLLLYDDGCTVWDAIYTNPILYPFLFVAEFFSGHIFGRSFL